MSGFLLSARAMRGRVWEGRGHGDCSSKLHCKHHLPFYRRAVRAAKTCVSRSLVLRMWRTIELPTRPSQSFQKNSWYIPPFPVSVLMVICPERVKPPASPSWPVEIRKIGFISLNKQKRSWPRQVTGKQSEQLETAAKRRRLPSEVPAATCRLSERQPLRAEGVTQARGLCEAGLLPRKPSATQYQTQDRRLGR